MSRAIRPDAGFTLLELLIVIAILGLLGVVGTVQLTGYLGRAKTDTAKMQLDQLANAIELYRLDVGRPPTSEEGLNALISTTSAISGWRGPYLRKSQAIVDPWGRMFSYKFPGEHGEYDLITFGGDGRVGGQGVDADVANWGR
jgi:general secretion pathway protein G